MKIPAGSANIDIRQHGYNNQEDDDNYLSLRSADGEFLLNGHYQVSVFKQQIPIQVNFSLLGKLEFRASLTFQNEVDILKDLHFFFLSWRIYGNVCQETSR